MKHLDLFSGIGGFALAAQWAGIETVAFCEIDDFACKVLNKNFPGVPVHRDIRELEGGLYAGIDIITGGYPCQPFSTAGKRKGADDPRHLWPEMFRVIKQARPAWVVCENVEGHIANGLDLVCDDMEGEGYKVQPLVIPACAVESPHIRNRVWIIANASGNGGERVVGGGRQAQASNEGARGQPDGKPLQTDPRSAKDGWRNGWGSRSRVCRVGDGLHNRLDRNKALGNAIVPQVAYEILRCIRDV